MYFPHKDFGLLSHLDGRHDGGQKYVSWKNWSDHLVIKGN